MEGTNLSFTRQEVITMKHLAEEGLLNVNPQDCPKNLTVEEFQTAMNSLSDRGLVDGGSDGKNLLYGDLTHKGKKLLKLFEQGITGISSQELTMLDEEILRKFSFHNELEFIITPWDICASYYEKVIANENPGIYISTIKAELREKDNSGIIAIQLYILLYYKYGNEPTYSAHVFESLQEFISENTTEWSSLENLKPVIDGLPHPDLSKEGQLEKTNKELREMVAKLNEEIVQLKKKIDIQNEIINAENEEVVVFKTGQTNNFKHKRITAMEAASKITPYIDRTLTIDDAKAILSGITGLAISTFNTPIGKIRNNRQG